MNTFSEKMITLPNGVVGILNSSLDKEKLPVVLMLHGFASQKNEVGDLFKNLSTELATNGIASLRIDFYGWGESKGNSFDSSVKTHLEDAELAFEYLLALDNIDKSKIGLLGFSLGGGISLVFSAKNKDKIKTLALWSSVDNFKENFLDSLGKDVFEKSKTQSPIEIDLGWRTVKLGKEFFESLDKFDIYEAVKNYDGSILTIIGTEDSQTNKQEKFKKLIEQSKQNKLLSIEGADHIFKVLDENYDYYKILINTTNNWFIEKLI